LRTEILDAAVCLFSELGGEEATIRRVARAVGIAPASIYQHFADKAALVRGVIEHDYERLSAVMREADESADPDDVVGGVRAQMRAYCRFAIANPVTTGSCWATAASWSRSPAAASAGAVAADRRRRHRRLRALRAGRH
jgi:AcrR family transcriptional regulator